MSPPDPIPQTGDSLNHGAQVTIHDPLEQQAILRAKRRARRRWSLAIGLGLLGGAIAAGLACLLVPVHYEAFALLKISRQSPAVLNQVAVSNDEFAMFKRTQVELIRSDVVMHGTLRQPDINKLSMVQDHKDDPVSWLSNQLIIDYPNDAEILRIAMKGTQPGELAKIVNKVVATYLREVVQHEREIRNQEKAKLEQSHVASMRELRQDLEALHKSEEVLGVSNSEAAQIQKRLVADQLADAMAERRDIVRDLRRVKLQIVLAEARQEKPQDAPPAEAPSAGMEPALTPLPLLEKEKEYLEATFAEVDKGVERKAKDLQSLEKFSADVASQRERLAQRSKIANQLEERLRLIDVESLAQDRITKVDDASVPAGTGAAVRRNAWAAVAGLLSFGLIVAGVALVVGGGKSSRL
ncbi:MAG: hypothetical protein HY288_17110 [Planctomycetia bacterium]|nr:hypothetical protein [Planctomycetia bacterium]